MGGLITHAPASTHTKPTCLTAPVEQDPGNLEADIQAGAKTGFALLWCVPPHRQAVAGCGGLRCAAAAPCKLVPNVPLVSRCGLPSPPLTCAPLRFAP